MNKADESDFLLFVENHEGRQACYVGNEALEKVEITILNSCIDLRMLKLEVLIEFQVSNQHNEINLVQLNFQLSQDI